MAHGPSGGTFVSAQRKIARSRRIIDTLEREASNWIDRNPAEAIHEIDPATGLESVKLIVPHLPIEIPLITGEALHHIRGSLDHMISSIVAHITGKEDRRTNFPFHETLCGFESLRTTPKEKDRHPLFLAAPDIWHEIEVNIRPYKEDGGNALLWAINKLNNADKHRLLLTTTSQTACNADLYRVGYQGNIATLIGPGEMIIGQGYNLGIEPPDKIQLILHEPKIMADSDLFLFLKASHSLALDIIERISKVFFAPNEEN